MILKNNAIDLRGIQLEPIIEFINQNVGLAPYIIFFLLLIAGFNIPISEDLMLFVSGALAAKYPEHFWSLVIGLYGGIYCSDIICYYMGRYLGPKLWEIKFFSKMVSKKVVGRISQFYEKFGFITLILGRFIPFGIRNALYLTAGLGRMNVKQFLLADLVACTISTTVYFTLYYYYGNLVIDYIRKSNFLIFALALIVVIVFLYKRGVFFKTRHQKTEPDPDP